MHDNSEIDIIFFLPIQYVNILLSLKGEVQ